VSFAFGLVAQQTIEFLECRLHNPHGLSQFGVPVVRAGTKNRPALASRPANPVKIVPVDQGGQKKRGRE
jgi:hypothetical protein